MSCVSAAGSPPRARGTGARPAARHAARGITPARGTARRPRAPGVSARITPACAGNRGHVEPPSRRAWDHPRVRGEQLGVDADGENESGSPPRARGTGSAPTATEAEGGITPACAGNRSPTSRRRLRPGDHPRVRGEQCSPTVALPRRTGSPPRARGNSGSHRLVPDVWRDHPRVRGEQRVWAAGCRSRRGSPPRARGTGDRGLRLVRGPGITPACAGNSTSSFVPRSMKRDHPRVRGEQPLPEDDINASHGSPPRARGTGSCPRWRRPRLRITPACAGNRRAEQAPRPGRRDHPRVRGEQSKPPPSAKDRAGSPPRARGTAGAADAAVRAHGITPACAGNRSRRGRPSRRRPDHPRVRGEQIPDFTDRAL